MTPLSHCLMYSNDATWADKLTVSLAPAITVRRLESPALVQGDLEQQPASLLLLDLLTIGALDLLCVITRNYPDTVVIAFGRIGSDPALEAERLGVYALEDTDIDRRRLTRVVQQALDYLGLARENRLMHKETLRLSTLTEAAQQRSNTPLEPSMDIRDFAAAMRHFTNVDTLLHRLVDEVANSLRVSRVGIFCRSRDVGSYRLRAGLRCLESSASFEYSETHAEVLWLTVHTHAISRRHLEHVQNTTTRVMLQEMLDRMGAEVLFPLQSHNRLLGWLFVGHLATGQPFEDRHLHNLISMTECVSTTLENALLYEEATIQKTLAETLLHSLPSGIVAVDDDGIVRWYNDSAQTMLGINSAAAIGRPIENLGSQLADLLRGTLGEKGTAQAAEWDDPATQRSYSTRTRRLSNQSRCLGALAVMQDTTDQKFMKEKQDRMDRATFWAELAASMSHEVRNPLVAIKTFAQLLPERYEDKEFQTEFKDLVSSEVERLNSIVDQIHAYAHPPALIFKPVDLKACIRVCCAKLFPTDPSCRIRLQVSEPDVFPMVSGDERALAEAFTHILMNSKEAMMHTASPEVSITLRGAEPAGQSPAVIISIKDNGPGMAPEILDKVYSPFSTTKARGLGLGLPIARRTILDHNGTITIHSNEFGVLTTIRLPVLRAEKERTT